MPRFLVLVLVGGVYAAAVQTVFLFPGDTPVPTVVWVAAFLGAFVALGLAIVTVRSARGRRGVPGVGASQSRLPRAARIGVLVTYTVAVLVVLVLTAAGVNDGPPGQPVVTSDGRYAVDNHGELTYVTRAVYRHAEEIGQRGFVGFALIFYLLSAVLIAFSVGWPTPVRPPKLDGAAG